MAGSLAYLDASALVKLAVREPETKALRSYLSAHPYRVSSRIAEVEVVRAVRRARPAAMSDAEAVLSRVGLVEIDAGILGVAAALRPSELRTLDAIHLASALSLGDDLGEMVVYDDRLAAAAATVGVAVVAPS